MSDENQLGIETAIIGLCNIAIKHMMDERYEAAQKTLLGLIMTLEGESIKLVQSDIKEQQMETENNETS